MWSVNQRVWKRANVCGDLVSSPRKHAGMSPANQRGRRGTLRRRRAEKLESRSKAITFALANIAIHEEGGRRGTLN